MNRYIYCIFMVFTFVSSPVMSTIDSEEYSYVSVGEYKLEYKCIGKGLPAIFLEPPSGISAAESFKNIFIELSKNNRVCRYERLGFGASDPVPEGLDQTVYDYAAELRALVLKEAKDQEIIIIGYSFGGFIARYYTSKYPDKVKGILLIDAAHEKWIIEQKEQMNPDDWAKVQDILDWFLGNLGHNYWDSQELVASSSLPPNLPIRIVSRGLDYQRIRKAGLSEGGFRIYNDLHNKYQLAQENFTSRTKRVIAQNSEHLIIETEPKVVLDAFEDLLLAIKN